MYKTMPSINIIGYSSDTRWAVVLCITNKYVDNTHRRYYTNANEQVIIISLHPTKGAADKALSELVKESEYPDKPYQLWLTEKQAQVLVNALDLYSRIGMGQFSEIAHVLRMNVLGNPSWQVDALAKVEEITREASSYWMGGSGDYYGITSEKINDIFRVAWDLQQVIRYRLAWDRKPEGGIQVHFDEPWKSSTEDFAIIKKV
jgi:hypothetical protein